MKPHLNQAIEFHKGQGASVKRDHAFNTIRSALRLKSMMKAVALSFSMRTSIGPLANLASRPAKVEFNVSG